VSATVALLRERFPRDSAAQLTQRLLRSADPAPGGVRSGQYGAGVLNPYRALSEEAGPVVAEVSAAPVVAVVAAGGGEWRRAGVFAAGGAGRAVLAGVVAAVVARGRRRGWQAAHGHDQMPG
jgi:membrane-anchored mycosin MYCP